MESMDQKTRVLLFWTTEEDVAELVKFLDEPFVKSMHSIFAYKGFDPAELIEKMEKLQPNKEALAKDVSILIALFLSISRRPAVKKILKKNKREILEMNRLHKLYEITKDSSDRNATTLRRIAIAFAPTTVRMLMKDKPNTTVTDMKLSEVVGDDFPWCIKTQIYLCTLPAHNNEAVAPHKVIFKTAVQATVCYSYLEAKDINKEGKLDAWTGEDYVNHVIKYCLISIKSEHLSEKDRAEVWTETLPSLSEGQNSMEKLIQHVKSEVPQFDSIFEGNFGAYTP